MARFVIEFTDEDMLRFQQYGDQQLSRLNLTPGSNPRIMTDEEIVGETISRHVIQMLYSQSPTPEIQAQQKAIQMKQQELAGEQQKLHELTAPKRNVLRAEDGIAKEVIREAKPKI